MILKEDLIYASFLDKFISIIEDEAAKNRATLVSGFLQSNQVSFALEQITQDINYIPLSAVINSGLLDNEGRFILENNELPSTKIGLFVDIARTQGQLHALGLEQCEWTEVQQLVFVTCCQEAVNQVLEGIFKVFYENVTHVSDTHRDTILHILKNMPTLGFSPIISKLHFETNALTLTSDTIAAITAQRELFLDASDEAHEIMIPDEELLAEELPKVTAVSTQMRIDILNELIPCLAVDEEQLNAEEALERSAKLSLLKLHSNILSMTLNDQWQINKQWLRPGRNIDLGSASIALPHSISNILDIITRTRTQKNNANYLNALRDIRSIAKSYEQDWYTWGRNQLPYISASPAVKVFLSSVLAINIGQESELQEPEPAFVVSSYTTSAINLGISLFHAGTGLISAAVTRALATENGEEEEEQPSNIHNQPR